MRIAYLILAHNHPFQLKRLTNALNYFDDHIFIHVNQKSDIHAFDDVAQQPRVCLISNRVPVHWGGFSMTNATLNLLHAARVHPATFDYYCFLSGSDYPLRSNAYIHSYFEDHEHGEFINVFDAQQEETSQLLPRLQSFVFERGLNRQTLFNTFLFQLNSKILATALLRRDYQRHLGDLKPYIGDAWWALSDRAIKYIFKFVERCPNVVNFYRHTAHPLEMFFHTIIGNSPFFNDVSNNLTYSDWLPNADSPSLLTDDHIDYLETRLCHTASVPGQKELLFARKFSPDRQDLMDRIDVDLRGVHAEANCV